MIKSSARSNKLRAKQKGIVEQKKRRSGEKFQGEPRERFKKKICEITNKLFVEKGYDKTTTRDIARAVGINNSGLYYYFENKETILYRILIEIMNTNLEAIKEIEQSDKTLKEKLTAIIDLHCRTYAFNPIRMDLIAGAQKSLSPEHLVELKAKQREYTKITATILDGMKGNNEILDLNTKVCAFALFGMVQWAHRWYNPDGEIKPEQLSQIFTQIFTRGIHNPNHMPG